MNKEDIIKNLEWSRDGVKESKINHQKRANDMLEYLLINKDENGASIILFDKTLETNANLMASNGHYLVRAIQSGFKKLIKQYLSSDSVSQFVLDKKIFKLIKESIAASDIQMYEIFESYHEDKGQMAMDILFHSLDYGNLKLIKYLVDKEVDGKYIDLDYSRAINGYANINSSSVKTDRLNNLYEYSSYFADIENQTENLNVKKMFSDEEYASFYKTNFFGKDLLGYIIEANDGESLKLYRNFNSDEQLLKNFVFVLRRRERSSNYLLEKDIQWCLLEIKDVDFSMNEDIAKKIFHYDRLDLLIEKIQLNKKLDSDLTAIANKHSQAKVKI